MSHFTATRECDRCAATITAFCPSLQTLASIRATLAVPVEVLAQEIARLENVPLDTVREYIDHRMMPKCEIVYGICPHCGKHLASRNAKQCLHCHSSWHER